MYKKEILSWGVGLWHGKWKSFLRTFYKEIITLEN